MTRKYIDADKLKAEIERRIEETKSMKPAFDQFWAGQISAFKGVIKIIDSLQQGKPSLPSNLDEAAEETAKKYYCSCLEKHNETGICDGCENVKLTFKAGAEWMAGQGESRECTIGMATRKKYIAISAKKLLKESGYRLATRL